MARRIFIHFATSIKLWYLYFSSNGTSDTSPSPSPGRNSQNPNVSGWISANQLCLENRVLSIPNPNRKTQYFKVIWQYPIVEHLLYHQKWVSIYQQRFVLESFTLVATAVTQMCSVWGIGQRNHDVRASCVAQPQCPINGCNCELGEFTRHSETNPKSR